MDEASDDSGTRAEIGKRLAAARERLGLSQAEVSRRAKVPANAYNQWERGRRLVNVFDAIRLAGVLGVTLDWIYRGDGASAAPAAPPAEDWSEETSAEFIDYGRYYVPEREGQIETVCALVPEVTGPHGAPMHLVELCCGEGLLAEALCARFPSATVHAWDGSAKMLETTANRLARFEGRFETREFDLAAVDWRRFPWPVQAVVSSLAVHHLDGAGKKALFADMAAALAPGGMLIIADLVEPESEAGRAVYARAWDQAVRARSLELDGGLGAWAHFRDDNWNYYADPNPDPVDQPSALHAQLGWLADAGLEAIDVHWLVAGHAIFSGRKPGG
jgi:tRNA (cmo5U34)-methyltransferase